MKPKLDLQQCKEISNQYREASPSWKEEEEFKRKLAHQFKVSVAMIDRVLDGSYKTVEDYEAKQETICTRCGVSIHPRDAVYMGHTDRFPQSNYHCKACAQFCAGKDKPKRRRQRPQRPGPAQLRRRDFVGIYVEEQLKTLHWQRPGLRPNELATASLTEITKALRLWRRDRLRFLPMSKTDIHVLFHTQPPDLPGEENGVVEIAKFPSIYEQEPSGRLLKRPFFNGAQFSAGAKQITRAYMRLMEKNKDNTDPSTLFIVARIRINGGEWHDDLEHAKQFTSLPEARP